MVRRFATLAWGTTALTVAVIAGGAIVRATGSGAGCGSHWPQCNGSIVPEGTTESIIEFTHRATSGLAFVAVVALFLMARRLYEPRHRVRRAGAMSVVFIAVEVVIGAALVMGEWVADDTSVARAVIDGFHLVNTLFLLAALTLTAWWASGGPPITRAAMNGEARRLIVGLVGVVIVAAAGALTALGDTLFPDAALTDDFLSSSHFLVRLRVIHPLLAIALAIYLIVVSRRFSVGTREPVPSLAIGVVSLVGLQLVIGFVNLALSAPLWLQVIHLLVADALWISLVLLTATQLADEKVAV